MLHYLTFPLQQHSQNNCYSCPTKNLSMQISLSHNCCSCPTEKLISANVNITHFATVVPKEKACKCKFEVIQFLKLPHKKPVNTYFTFTLLLQLPPRKKL